MTSIIAQYLSLEEFLEFARLNKNTYEMCFINAESTFTQYVWKKRFEQEFTRIPEDFTDVDLTKPSLVIFKEAFQLYKDLRVIIKRMIV